MVASSLENPLLVPVANPETAERLLDTALDIARERSIPLIALHVVEVPPQLPLGEGSQLVTEETEQLLESITERAGHESVTVDTRIRFARKTARGIVGSVDAYGASALLMGWRGRPRRRDVILGSFLDRVLREAPCDVYVKRIQQPSSAPDSMLVPVAGGPHDKLAVELAGTIARGHDSTIELVHVEDPDSNAATAADDLLTARRKLLPDEQTVWTTTIERSDVTDAILKKASHHDLTLLGATRDPFLKRRLVGSVAQTVGRGAESSVIVTRKHLEASSR